jgi:prepilin-type N-terminal cleavage/methylation domain-containing protein
MIDRLSSERGMTLPEALVTMVIATILALATFSLVDVTMRRTSEINSRSDGVQRGRVAMDLMTRQLRSQVCLGPSASVSRSIVAGSATSVTFYTELGDPSTKGIGTAPPRAVEKRSLTLETEGAYAPGTLVERRYPGTPAPGQPLGFTFESAPSTTRELARPVVLTPTPGKEGLTPALFRFYAWNVADPNNPKLTTELPATPMLSDENVKKVAKVEITFRSKPRKDDVASTVFYNEVTLRTVDPNVSTELIVPCL